MAPVRETLISWLKNKANKNSQMERHLVLAKLNSLGVGAPNSPQPSCLGCQQSVSTSGVLSIPATPGLLSSILKSFRTFCQVIKPRSKSLANIPAVFLRNVLIRNTTKIF